MHFTSDKWRWRLSHVVSKDRPFTASEETWLENGPKHMARPPWDTWRDTEESHGDDMDIQSWCKGAARVCFFGHCFWILLDEWCLFQAAHTWWYLVSWTPVKRTPGVLHVFLQSWGYPSWHAETCLNFKIWQIWLSWHLHWLILAVWLYLAVLGHTANSCQGFAGSESRPGTGLGLRSSKDR